jgi:4'-phosphopantetheinyl transferase
MLTIDSAIKVSRAANLNLSTNELHLWLCESDKIVDELLLKDCLSVLNDEELDRYSNFSFDHDRHQYLITRAMIRNILSLYRTRISPDAWVFVKNRYGKPSVCFPSGDDTIEFNISHTKKMVVVATSRVKEMGVDVEFISRPVNLDIIAKKHFSEVEVRALMTLAAVQRKVKFFELWTLKESYLKACGKGLSLPMNDLAFQFLDDKKIAVDFSNEFSDCSNSWRFWLFDISSEHRMSVALKRESCPAITITVRNIVPFQTFSLSQAKLLRSN